MLKLVDPANGNTPSLARYADDPRFTALVGELDTTSSLFGLMSSCQFF